MFELLFFLLIIVYLNRNNIKAFLDKKKKEKKTMGSKGSGFNPFARKDENGDVYQPQPSGSAKGVGKVILGIVALILVAILGSAAFYNVGEQEQAVLTMFGQIVRTDTAGLYFKVPLLQQVHKVDMTTHGIGIGYNVENGQNISVDEEGIMITSDFNFVDIDFYLEYKVSDPVAYLYNTKEPEVTMKNMALACIRSTVINYPVDEVITTAKGQIQAEVKEKLQNELSQHQVGLSVVNVSVQDAEPPTPEIVQAFKEVETAKQGKETAVNNAKKYQNEQIPRAEANADKITQQAEADKQARIAEAEGQAERFDRMYAEYQKYPLITKQRMFYEAMEEVLPGVKVIITDGNTQELLPIEAFNTTDEPAAVVESEEVTP